MPQTAPPGLTPAPASPSRSVPGTFATLADAFLSWLAGFGAEAAALAANVYANAADAFTSATAGAASASAAQAAQAAAAGSAAAAANSAGAALWVSGATYAVGDVRWSPITRYTYRRTVAGAGTTDPSADTTNWSLTGAAVPQLILVSGTAQAAQANGHYVLTNVSATTVTLPPAPAVGDVVWVTVGNALATNVVARNGQPIMGLAEDMTLDNPSATAGLRYAGAGLGWRLI